MSLSHDPGEIAATRNVAEAGLWDRHGMSVRCIVVDDNPGFLETASKVLSRGGLTVVGSASTSADALARVRETQPEVVLVDILLGSESGLDLARELAADSGSHGTKVILISTHSAEDFADLIAASPAIGFLPKSRLSAEAVEELLAESSV
jgi:two-component system, NarL family, nitrate/nitrite response regulator NarL